MTYEELASVCKKDAVTFKTAFILFGGIGAKNIGKLKPEHIKSDYRKRRKTPGFIRGDIRRQTKGNRIAN